MWRPLIVTVIIAALSQQVIRFLLQTHAFQVVFNHAPGPCQRLSELGNSSEDATVLPNGIAIISSGFSSVQGRLLRLDLANTGDVSEWSIEGEFDRTTFKPHGLSVWRDGATGAITLFVINHHPSEDRVEVFRHDGSRKSRVLQYQRAITDPKIRNLNDVVATGPDSFYATVDVGTLNKLEIFLLYPGASVIHYTGGTTTTVDTGLRIANGINVSPDSKFLYVSELGGGNIITYRILKDNSLERQQVFYVGSGLDNIDVDPQTGALWVGAHPNLLLVIARIIFPEKGVVSPSQVLRLTVSGGEVTGMTEVFSNDGSSLIGSSVAVRHQDTLFIGTVDEGALVCQLVNRN